jgi:hypothetical protein
MEFSKQLRLSLIFTFAAICFLGQRVVYLWFSLFATIQPLHIRFVSAYSAHSLSLVVVFFAFVRNIQQDHQKRGEKTHILADLLFS